MNTEKRQLKTKREQSEVKSIVPGHKVQLWGRFLSNSNNKQNLIEFLTKECNFNYRHFFCHIAAESWLASCNLWRKQENDQSQVTVNFLTCPGWDLNPGSGDRQLPLSWPSGYDAWLPSVSLQVWVSTGSRSWVKDPKELFVKKREFLLGSGFLNDLSYWKRRKTPSLSFYRPHDYQGRPLHKIMQTTSVPEGTGVKSHVSNLWWSLLRADHRWCWRSPGIAFNSRGSRHLPFAPCCTSCKLSSQMKKKVFCLAFFPTYWRPLYLRRGTRIHTRFVSIQVDVVNSDCCKSMIGLWTYIYGLW